MLSAFDQVVLDLADQDKTASVTKARADQICAHALRAEECDASASHGDHAGWVAVCQ